MLPGYRPNKYLIASFTDSSWWSFSLPNTDRGTRIRGLEKCQNENWPLLRGSAEISSPNLPSVGINTRQEPPPTICHARRL